MTLPLTIAIAAFFLAAFVGLYIISRIPTQLHTPLMSATNALHGLVLLGAMVAIGGVGEHSASASFDAFSLFLAIVAVAFGTINIVGGFLVTDRMLVMFRVGRKPDAPAQAAKPAEDPNVIRVS
jgi:NAD(P) transhydrogenase subunit alpha